MRRVLVASASNSWQRSWGTRAPGRTGPPQGQLSAGPNAGRILRAVWAATIPLTNRVEPPQTGRGGKERPAVQTLPATLQSKLDSQLT